MRLAFDASNLTEIRPRDIIDYSAFRRRFRTGDKESELHLVERFHAAKLLFERGSEHVYAEVPLVARGNAGDTSAAVTADVCGIKDDNLTLVFCETTPPTEQFLEKLEIVEKASNARAILLYPFSTRLPRVSGAKTRHEKLDVAFVPWLDEQIDDAFQQVMEMVELFANRTRVRMLTPLLEKRFRKRDYRRVINPKLLYENLSSLIERGIIDEDEDESYALTRLGSDLFGEYLAFRERVRRVIERETEASRGGEL
jgi:DNA-binding HxlR family transcriptional regulator